MGIQSPFRGLALAILLAILIAGCGGGGSASAGDGADGAGTSGDSAVSASASQAFTVSAVAGTETGLRRLASIDGTLAAGERNNVEIHYGGDPVSGSDAHGLLYNCGGLLDRRDCDVYGTVTYDRPGSYPYTVTYQPRGPFADPVTLTGRIVAAAPEDFVVVSIGDSVASGEGNPVLPVSGRDGAYWDDLASNSDVPGLDISNAGCHRSGGAGPARAVRRLQQTNDITFVHIACSGAHFGNAVQGDKETLAYRLGQIIKIDLQIPWLRERFPAIDVLILSGGANNATSGGFSGVVNECLRLRRSTNCSEDEAFREELATNIAALGEKYAALNRIIREQGTQAQQPDVVAITEYFDPTRDANGEFPGPLISATCGLGTISPSEWAFLYNNMVVPLNDQVHAAARAHGWELVGGIAEAFRRHGYCASATPGDFSGASWVVKAPESITIQGDVGGTSHPDPTGQGVYADAIYDTIVRANPPRTRATAITADGEPYVFGTWVNQDVEVTLSAGNPIRESGVGQTYYAADEPLCTADSVAMGACRDYGLPFTVSQSGRNTVSFFSTNAYGAAETKAEPVEVLIDREPPVMTCLATPDELWPPNHRMVDVTASITAVDEVSGPADYTLVAVADSYGDPADSIQGFDIGTADVNGTMRSDRAGNLGTRLYTLTYESADAVGNIGTCDVAVRVPHDQGH